MTIAIDIVPIDLTCKKSRLLLRVGNPSPIRSVPPLGIAAVLTYSAFADSLSQLPVVVGEKQKGGGGAKLITHEEHRNARKKEVERDNGPVCLPPRQLVEAFAQRPVPDHVVGLDIVDEMVQINPIRRCADIASSIV